MRETPAPVSIALHLGAEHGPSLAHGGAQKQLEPSINPDGLLNPDMPRGIPEVMPK
jgi:hypothetical protein